MIAMISVRQTADKPNFPLRPLAVFTGSSMTLGIVDVPPTREGIAVTGVSLAVENAVGAVSAAAAVESGGVWTATIPASHFAAVGVVAMGVTISASGTDESGAARSWIIGKGDLTILPADGVPVPGETLQNVHLRDSVPQTPMKGDLCEGANGWQIYTGDAWAEIGGNAPEPSTSAPLMDGTASAGSSAAYARGDHVHPTDTSRVPTSRTVNGKALSADVTLSATDVGAYPAEVTSSNECESNVDLYVNARFRSEHIQGRQPEDDSQWCDVATLLHIADEFDQQTQYDQNALVCFQEDGWWTLYKCTNASGHTGAWVAADFAVATVEDVLSALRTALAGKVSKSGDTMTGTLILATNTTAPGVRFNRSNGYSKFIYEGGDDSIQLHTVDSNGNSVGSIVFPENKFGTLALTAELPYSQTATTGGSSIALSARSGNRYDFSAVTGTVSVTLPTVESGKCADVVCTIVTGATVPTLSFPSGTVFIAADSAWQTLAASSYNVFSFTSTGAPNEWIVGRITSALPTA